MELHRLLAAAAALLLAGCASLVPAPALGPNADCAAVLTRLDEAINDAGVRDAEAERIAGFPGLRVTREVAARRDEEPFERWWPRLAELEREAREVELGNLPAAAWPRAGDPASAAAAHALALACPATWEQAFARDPALRERLRERAQVPDRYSLAARTFGLYPLTRLPFYAGVQAWEAEHRERVQRWAASPPPVHRYALDAALNDGGVLARHAPVIEIEDRGPAAQAFDRFGAVVWSTTSAATTTPGVDAQHPVVYTRMASTRVAGRWLPQLVYTLWFPERPAQGTFDLLAGRLDGVVLRLTLSEDHRRVLMLDSMHACGCWHLFIPAPEVTLRPGAPQDREWAFVPMTLPTLAEGERLVLRLSSADHQLLGVARAADASLDSSNARTYELQPEARLRRLPLPASAGGGTRSLYGPDGLVAGSERAERFLFWPMGIASAGTMRQWGHHATAFVGRRHFDDPDLLPQRFLFPPP